MLKAEILAEMVLEFSLSSRRNEWIIVEDLKVYVRNAIHMLEPGQLISTLDLASAEFSPRGRGNFRAFLEILELRAEKPLYAENVLNPRLALFFARRESWKPCSSLCFYRYSSILERNKPLNRSGGS